MEQLEQTEQPKEEYYRECTDCGEVKILSEFHKDKNFLGGHKTVCKDCVRKKNNSLYTSYTHDDIVKFIESGEVIPDKFFRALKYITSRVLEDGRTTKIKQYHMLCLCGREKYLTRTQLNRNSSCADPQCVYNTHNRRAEDSILKESVEDGFFIKSGAWNRYILGASDRNIDFEITIDDLFELWRKQEGRCNKTGHKLSPGSKNKKQSHTWSINRIDSKKGYVKGNVELTAMFVNLLHNKYDEEPVDLYCMKRIIWLMKNNKEYVEELKNVCRLDEEEPSVLDYKWKMANRYKGESVFKGVMRKPLIKKVEEQSNVSDSCGELLDNYEPYQDNSE